jgi:trans-aconitate methyltransferase
MDSSENLLAHAAKNFPQYSFIRHNVTETPFPVQPRVMYVRFLLTHLTDIVSLVNRWVEELPAGGVIFIEEAEAIDSDIPVFAEYIKVAADMIASAGGYLYAGEILSKGAYNAEVLHNESFAIKPANSTVAAWFHINTVTLWEQEQFVFDTVSPADRRRISKGIQVIRDSGDMGSGITWKLRRLILRPAEIF